MCCGSRRGRAVTKGEHEASVIQFITKQARPVSQHFVASHTWTFHPPPTSPASCAPPPPPPSQSTLTRARTHTRAALPFLSVRPSVRCVFLSQGREESGLGSKLTINSTLPELKTRSNTSTPSFFFFSLLPALPPSAHS